MTTGYPLTNCMCPCSKIPYVCLCSQSVRKAHDSMTNGRLYVTHGDLFGVSINRSPTSYLANPAVERAKYVTANARTHTHTRTRPPHTFCCLLRHSMGAGRHGHLLGFYTLQFSFLSASCSFLFFLHPVVCFSLHPAVCFLFYTLQFAFFLHPMFCFFYTLQFAFFYTHCTLLFFYNL